MARDYLNRLDMIMCSDKENALKYAIQVYGNKSDRDRSNSLCHKQFNFSGRSVRDLTNQLAMFDIKGDRRLLAEKILKYHGF